MNSEGNSISVVIHFHPLRISNISNVLSPDNGHLISVVKGKLDKALVQVQCQEVSGAVVVVAIVEDETFIRLGLEDHLQLVPQESRVGQAKVGQIRRVVEMGDLKTRKMWGYIQVMTTQKKWMYRNSDGLLTEFTSVSQRTLASPSRVWCKS